MIVTSLRITFIGLFNRLSLNTFYIGTKLTLRVNALHSSSVETDIKRGG